MTPPLSSGSNGDIFLANYAMGLRDNQIKRSRRNEIPPSITYEGYDTRTGLILTKEIGGETTFYSKQIYNTAVAQGELLNPRPGTNGGLPRADALSVRREPKRKLSNVPTPTPTPTPVADNIFVFIHYSILSGSRSIFTGPADAIAIPLPGTEASKGLFYYELKDYCEASFKVLGLPVSPFPKYFIATKKFGLTLQLVQIARVNGQALPQEIIDNYTELSFTLKIYNQQGQEVYSEDFVAPLSLVDTGEFISLQGNLGALNQIYFDEFDDPEWQTFLVLVSVLNPITQTRYPIDFNNYTPDPSLFGQQEGLTPCPCLPEFVTFNYYTEDINLITLNFSYSSNVCDVSGIEYQIFYTITDGIKSYSGTFFSRDNNFDITNDFELNASYDAEFDFADVLAGYSTQVQTQFSLDPG